MATKSLDKSMHLNQASFLKSAAQFSQSPEDLGQEVAFAGRSNVGKSSCINALTNQKQLARSSKTPGRTQLINFFSLSETQRIVDLPGYGYARVSKSIKEQWQQHLSNYLQKRKSLKGLILIVDIRQLLKPTDISMLEWAQNSSLPIHILLNKADKLSNNQQKNSLFEIKEAVKQLNLSHISYQLFSATSKLGKTEANKQIITWLCG